MRLRVPLDTKVGVPWAERRPLEPEPRYWLSVFDPAALRAAAGRRLHWGFRVFGMGEGGTYVPTWGGAMLGPAVVVGSVAVTRQVEFRADTPGRAAATLRVTVFPGTGKGLWLPPVPDRWLVLAFYRLLRAWPAGWKAIEHSLLEDRVILVPDIRQLPPALAADPRAVEAVVWTALVHIVNGRDPQEAIRRAHAEPERALAVSASTGSRPRGRSPILRGWRKWHAYRSAAATWACGPVAVPPDVGWLLRVQDGQAPPRVDGFTVRVGVGKGFPWGAYHERISRLAAAGAGCEEGGWVLAAHLFRLALHADAPAGAVLEFSCRGPADAWFPADVGTEEAQKHLATVLRAWPPEQKLLVLDATAWDSVAYGVEEEVGQIAVRTVDGSPESAQLVLARAFQAVLQGAAFQDLRRWLASLDSRSLRVLEVLGQLGP